MGQTTRTIQAVDRAVAILRQLAVAPAGMTLGNLARRLGLTPQTLQGLLRTLQIHGMVIQNGRGQPYALGPAIHALSQTWAQNRDLAELARNALIDLANTTNENVLLVEMQGQTLVCLAEIPARRSLMVRSEIGSPERLHTMATAKVLLAFMPLDCQSAVLQTMTYARLGPNAVTSEAQLRRQLEAVQRQGHVVCIEEAAIGVAAMAVPVRDHTGQVVAALGVSLPVVRLESWTQTSLLERLKATTANIESCWCLRFCVTA